jgi:hypothetical protein
VRLHEAAGIDGLGAFAAELGEKLSFLVKAQDELGAVEQQLLTAID